tara:strand:+ start:15798 stop:16007 length:210 start_codon:yes stop_codon:yes gene_type:complete
MNHNVIKELIEKIEKRNFNKKKTQSKKPMNKIFKTKNTKTVKLWNEISELINATNQDKSFETFIKNKKY